MAGNRDFLVGRRFASASGTRILKDPQLVDFGGMRTLISHGDRYCSDDVGYQRWRYFSRNAFVQRSEEHTSELQSLMRISYAVFCLQKKKHSDDSIYTHHKDTT